MALLSKQEIESLPTGIYVTRKCDQCGIPIMQSHSYSSHGKDFEKRKCMLRWEKENLTKKGKKHMSSKSKKKKRDDEEEEEETKKKKKRSRDDDDEEEDDEEEDDESSDDDDDDDEDDKKKKKSKSKGKDKKKSKSSKDEKSSKKAGGYRAGSNSAIMFERLSDQKRHSFKEVFKGIDSPLPTLRRLERHAKKNKKFTIAVDKDNETIRMKKR